MFVCLFVVNLFVSQIKAIALPLLVLYLNLK